MLFSSIAMKIACIFSCNYVTVQSVESRTGNNRVRNGSSKLLEFQQSRGQIVNECWCQDCRFSGKLDIVHNYQDFIQLIVKRFSVISFGLLFFSIHCVSPVIKPYKIRTQLSIFFFSLIIKKLFRKRMVSLSVKIAFQRVSMVVSMQRNNA